MPQVKSEILVNADVDRLFAIARDVERFPEFMPDVKSVRITQREGGCVVSEWSGLVSDLRVKVNWSEEDVWDEQAHTCRFRQLKGDFQQYEGVWEFEPEGPGTRMRITLDYRYEVPLVGPLLKSLVAKLMRDNTEAMLQALKCKAEEGG